MFGSFFPEHLSCGPGAERESIYPSVLLHGILNLSALLLMGGIDLEPASSLCLLLGALMTPLPFPVCTFSILAITLRLVNNLQITSKKRCITQTSKRFPRIILYQEDGNILSHPHFTTFRCSGLFL